jgi:hypothetical protein
VILYGYMDVIISRNAALLVEESSRPLKILAALVKDPDLLEGTRFVRTQRESMKEHQRWAEQHITPLWRGSPEHCCGSRSMAVRVDSGHFPGEDLLLIDAPTYLRS